MSETISDTAAIAEKLLRYRHLLPPLPNDLLARMYGAGGPESPRREPPEAAVPPETPVWPDLDPDEARDRAVGCLLGLAVGDAIGSAVDGLPRDSFPAVEGPTGGGPLGLAPGQCTSMTAMALCLADTLIACRTVDIEDLAIRLNEMLTDGEWALGGTAAGIDAPTRAAIERRAAEQDAAAPDVDDTMPGHGSLVRLAPLAIFGARDPDTAEALAVRQSRVTHAKVESLDCCRLFAAQLTDALNGAFKESAMRPRVMALCPAVLFVSAGEWRDKPREAVGSAGHVVRTLEAALWSVWRTDNFRDAVLTAANLGGAAGGIAAVCGQLAGALYGASSIPEEWLEKLAWREKLEVAAGDLFDARLAAD
jgi:ADP-ribosyl-[dinitrogen reductase] hydrolase